MKEKLPRAFYARDTISVANDLLGKYLVHEVDGIERIGKIVEVEAYLGVHDLAAHSSKGRTTRTQIMFGPAGYAYVYLIYGIYHCFNIVTEHEGSGSAVLIRALEPIQNIEGRTQGPGLLCKAMGINKDAYGQDLLSDKLYLMNAGVNENISIVKSTRIGVHYAKHWAAELLRFYIKGNPFISKI
jgi:DNA-3-methyladenine glycosylase